MPIHEPLFMEQPSPDDPVFPIVWMKILSQPAATVVAAAMVHTTANVCTSTAIMQPMGAGCGGLWPSPMCGAGGPSGPPLITLVPTDDVNYYGCMCVAALSSENVKIRAPRSSQRVTDHERAGRCTYRAFSGPRTSYEAEARCEMPPGGTTQHQLLSTHYPRLHPGFSNEDELKLMGDMALANISRARARDPRWRLRSRVDLRASLQPTNQRWNCSMPGVEVALQSIITHSQT